MLSCCVHAACRFPGGTWSSPLWCPFSCPNMALTVHSCFLTRPLSCSSWEGLFLGLCTLSLNALLRCSLVWMKLYHCLLSECLHAAGTIICHLTLCCHSNHASPRCHFCFLYFFFFSPFVFFYFKGPVGFSMFWRLSLQTHQHPIDSIITKLKVIWTFRTYGLD